MTKKITIFLSLFCFFSVVAADTIHVAAFRHVGPIEVRRPVMLDSTDVNAQRYDTASLLRGSVSFDGLRNGAIWSGEALPSATTSALHLLGAKVSTADYFVGEVKLQKAPKSYQLYVDGNEASEGKLELEPGSHTLSVKYLSDPHRNDSLRIVLVSDSAAKVQATRLSVDSSIGQGKRLTFGQLQKSKRYCDLEVSPDGKWFIVGISTPNGEWADYDYFLCERATGRRVRLAQNSHWLPRTNKFYQVRGHGGKNRMVVVDPGTLAEEIWVEELPDTDFDVFPTEDRLLISVRQEGPKDANPEAFRFLHPDDRQPGWRDRNYLAIYDIKSGLKQQLTFGYNNQWVSNIRCDGQRLLLCKSDARLTQRPTSLYSIFELDLATMRLDTLVDRDGFIGSAQYSPDGTKICIEGSPECLGGIGCVVPDSMTASMVDQQLYVMDIATRKIVPLTKTFDPMVANFDWHAADGKIYFTAEVCDSCALYRIDPSSGSIERLNQPEEVVGRWALADNAQTMVFVGESNDHSWRLYDMEVGKKPKAARLLENLNSDVFDGTDVASAVAWTCRNSIGDEVHCRYYLPNGFDASAKYPMIVYYYGGCSGTLRNFEFPYPWTVWAAQGYVVLVVNPSGATGFGQEWAARHVNTAGADPARDVIEATTAFCDEHPYVNRERLGCIGASYGGFLTQYLQTVTDIFRCAVSHAGISDHSNYWGYGYWGYTYSEVSMANSYPWTRPDLYVDRSPLYHADRIKSSMLFLHGTDDTNVPYNNSVQMYTALKLLGKDVEMLSFKGDNHGIGQKHRLLWQNATMAWFARCLKDDPTWWQALYPERTL